MNLPNTESRVLEHTDEKINSCIRRKIEIRIFYFARHPEEIDCRLRELEREWDIERTLEANAAGFSLFGLLMSSRNKKWLVLPLTVSSFLMQHALQGWCPPVPLFRRMGIRTTSEINTERYALKLLRGDFDQAELSQVTDPDEKARKILQMVEKA